MKFSKICIILFILLISLCAVSASDKINGTADDALQFTQNNQYAENEVSYTFADLTVDINATHDTFDLKHDYAFDNQSDNGPVLIDKDNFVINGNNHRLNGNNQTGIFNITGNNITINNLVFVKGNASEGGAIYSKGNITLNNVTFISNYARDRGGAIVNSGGNVNCNNTKFIDNYAKSGSAIYGENHVLNLHNTFITSSIPNMRGQIYVKYSTLYLDNVDFVNISSIYACALYLESCNNLTLLNSRFVNLTANITAGAIAVKSDGNVYIRGCEFVNTKSFKNAGAINVDYLENFYNATILDTSFVNSSSMMGGAYIQLSGNLFMNNTNFISNRAVHNGGAAYLAFINDCVINNCIFDSNVVEDFEDYPGCGGAIYSDYNDVVISNSKFLNNSAGIGNAIFAIDTYYDIANSIFANNTNALYTYYDCEDCIWNNNDCDNESIITNQTINYVDYVGSPALKYELANNTITVTGLPERFDLRDWGWITPVKEQGRMGSCWTFGLTSAVESAILKAYGVGLDLSESNLHHNMLKYFHYGCTDIIEGGFGTVAASYMVGWYGPVFEETDIYDEVGKLSPFITTGSDVIHVQDVIFLSNDDVPNCTELKSAIMKYGALSVGYFAASGEGGGYLNPNTSAQYVYDVNYTNHEVSLIGWDDNYSKYNFLTTPPGDGAWIIKNSWGTSAGDEGFYYISYYDKSFVTLPMLKEYAVGIILDNTVPYNKNYGYDYMWNCDFYDLEDLFDVNGTVTYCNSYVSADDDLIAGVGTYFYSGGVNYTVEIYVNGQLRLTQEGVSPFAGFHTIKLDEYVPVKMGDEFAAVMTSNLVPVALSIYNRVHFTENMSFVIYNDTTYDLYSLTDSIACLKVYTVEDGSKIMGNMDISVAYANQSFFTVKVATDDGHAVAGASVEFTINGKTTNATTDGEGIAKLEITELPGTYVVTAVYNNQSYENNVTVELDLQNCKVESGDVSVDYASGSFFAVKVVSGDGKLAVAGESVIFIINGKTANATTDENGIAKIEITDVPGEYELTTIYNAKLYKNTVTVKQVLKASKAKVKRTAKKFALKAKLKINGTPVNGEKITFKFNGKKYKAVTNSKGIAKATVKKNVIKKLKKGKKYKVKVIYLEDTIITTVKVK